MESEGDATRGGSGGDDDDSATAESDSFAGNAFSDDCACEVINGHRGSFFNATDRYRGSADFDVKDFVSSDGHNPVCSGG